MPVIKLSLPVKWRKARCIRRCKERFPRSTTTNRLNGQHTIVPMLPSVRVCPTLTSRLLNSNAKRNDAVWREECHPKHYLQFLNPDYSETGGGRAALTRLNWASLDNNNQHRQVIRALFADLAQWFGMPNPLPGGGEPSVLIKWRK